MQSHVGKVTRSQVTQVTKDSHERRYIIRTSLVKRRLALILLAEWSDAYLRY